MPLHTARLSALDKQPRGEGPFFHDDSVASASSPADNLPFLIDDDDVDMDDIVADAVPSQ